MIHALHKQTHSEKICILAKGINAHYSNKICKNYHKHKRKGQQLKLNDSTADGKRKRKHHKEETTRSRNRKPNYTNGVKEATDVKASQDDTD